MQKDYFTLKKKLIKKKKKAPKICTLGQQAKSLQEKNKTKKKTLPLVTSSGQEIPSSSAKLLQKHGDTTQ